MRVASGKDNGRHNPSDENSLSFVVEAHVSFTVCVPFVETVVLIPGPTRLLSIFAGGSLVANVS